jgi:hypothetical protein
MTSLITLPIRLPLEITWRAAKLGVGVLRTVTGLLEHDRADERVPWPAEEDVSPYVAEPIAVEDVEDVEHVEDVEDVEDVEHVEHVEAAVDFDVPSEEELAPRHVDSEPALAYESGPADDVGAEVHVDAPWEGYDRMRAADIVARLRAADDATRAVVRLYEQQGKARSSVLAATA